MLFQKIINFIKDNQNIGKRTCFQLDKEGLDCYIKWAFAKNCLLLSFTNNNISGIAIAYPLSSKYNGSILSLIPSDEDTEINEELRDLCIMDWIALNSKSRKCLILQFQTRFPNWENQNKYGIQFGKQKLLTNKYMNLLKGIN